MQIVIALPEAQEIGRLESPVCGVPLLRRVVTTAVRSGGSSVVLILPPCWPVWRLRELLPPIESVPIETVGIGHRFDPRKPQHWRAIAPQLDEQFLWLPYDYVAHRPALTALLSAAARRPGVGGRFAGVSDTGRDSRILERPTVLTKPCATGEVKQFQVVAAGGQPGVPLRTRADLKRAESELVRRSGKATDGIYSSFNRRLCRPAVRWLSHTKITPNAVSFVGLAVAALAGLCFAEGSWPADLAGALLFFISGLFDEMDGMLARLKFQESAFGCWLETMADYSSYLLIFAGMTAGGYRRGGWVYLALGAALLFGCLLSFAVISIQRKLAAPADKPNEYSQRYLAALDRDAANPISRLVRQLQFLTKKGVLVHYLLLFAIFGLVPLVMFLAAIGANIAWVVTIYFNRRLFSSGRRRRAQPVETGAVGAGVEK